MIYFDCDYMAGAHPKVLERLVETNMLHTPGYGNDEFTKQAKKKILDSCGIEDGEVYFLEGGTQTNLLVVTRLLDYNQGVIAADTAHIAVHEAGAIEASGHKVITLKGENGKLSSNDVEKYLSDYDRDDTKEHIVCPGMVYISFPTELGTLYTKDELAALHEVCKQHDIPLYIDGARLAYGLASSSIKLKELASLCDVFYIGGTKCGALFGEAIVATRKNLLPRFFSLCKQRGAILAKGRLLALQFDTLFTDGLYESIGRHAVDLAMKLKKRMLAKGYNMFIDSPTNQQFFILDNKLIERLKENASFELWGPLQDKETPVRFVTDWTTTEKDINDFLQLL